MCAANLSFTIWRKLFLRHAWRNWQESWQVTGLIKKLCCLKVNKKKHLNQLYNTYRGVTQSMKVSCLHCNVLVYNDWSTPDDTDDTHKN